ncbi:MAG: cytochrome-c oxidase, cbb3-type subunit III [Amphiplicatus sp.]
MTAPDRDDHSGVETTGHEWDGVKELNNPLPRWWLWTFYASVAWSVVYWILMPAWPGISGYTKGVRNHSERANVEAAIGALDAARGGAMQQLLAVNSIADVEKDPALLQYGMAAGASLFGDNCATCHGAGGQGFSGYPNLNDDSWLWGGRFEDIRQTIRYGIRSGHEKARFNMMQAYGRDGLLPAETISDLTDYVLHLSGKAADEAAVRRAAPIFAQQCASCHGAEGKGDQRQGAPNLADAIGLYGIDRATIAETLRNGRGGVMPAWEGRLSEEQIVALAVYVHSLGGGE